MTKSEKSKFKYGIGEYKIRNEKGDLLVDFADLVDPPINFLPSHYPILYLNFDFSLFVISLYF